MLEISELIYETCKTYLLTQVKFILILEVLIGSAMAIYFGVLQADGSLSRCHHSDLQSDRHRRKCFRGMVWNSSEYLREFPHGICQPAGKTLSRAMTFRCRPA